MHPQKIIWKTVDKANKWDNTDYLDEVIYKHEEIINCFMREDSLLRSIQGEIQKERTLMAEKEKEMQRDREGQREKEK